MRRAITDASITAVSAAALILALVMIDDRVRSQISAALDTGHPGAALTDLGQRAIEVVTIVAVAARSQSLEHAPLVIFALAAALLVVCMLRT